MKNNIPLFLISKFILRFIDVIFANIFQNKTKKLEINDTKELFIKIKF